MGWLALGIAAFVVWVLERFDIEEVKAPFALAFVGLVILAIKYLGKGL